MGGSPRLRVFLTYRCQLLGEVGTDRPVKLPCVLEGDSRGCGAEPPAHVGHEVETIILTTSCGEPPTLTLLSLSGVSSLDMTVGRHGTDFCQIGANSNIQDGVVIHSKSGAAVVIGENTSTPTAPSSTDHARWVMAFSSASTAFCSVELCRASNACRMSSKTGHYSPTMKLKLSVSNSLARIVAYHQASRTTWTAMHRVRVDWVGQTSPIHFAAMLECCSSTTVAGRCADDTVRSGAPRQAGPAPTRSTAMLWQSCSSFRWDYRLGNNTRVRDGRCAAIRRAATCIRLKVT